MAEAEVPVDLCHDCAIDEAERLGRVVARLRAIAAAGSGWYTDEREIVALALSAAEGADDPPQRVAP